MPLPQRNGSCASKTRQTVDQASYSSDPCAVLAAMIAIGGGDTLKASDLPNGLFDHKAKAGKGAVIHDILWWSILATRLAARREALLSQARQLQIGQITRDAHVVWQAFQQTTGFQQLDVGGRSGHTVGYIHNPSSVAVYGDLAFEGVLFLFARIMAVIVRRTLHALLKTIHNHTQFGDGCQQLGQLTTALLARIRQPHPIPSALFQDRQHALNQTRYRRVADPKQIAQHLMDQVQPQPDNGQQQVVTQFQFKGMSGTDGALALGMTEATCFRFQVQRQNIIHQLIEQINGQTRTFLKHIRMVAEVLIAHDHLGDLSGRFSLFYPIVKVNHPLDWCLYRRKIECEANGVPFRSKPDIARAIIEQYQPLPDTQTIVLTDSWYADQKLLKLCRQRDFHYIGAVKANRKLKVGQHQQQVQQWRDVLPKSAFERVKLKDERYKVWSANGQLSCGQTVKVLVNRRIGVKKWRYLVCTDTRLDAQTILATYFVRWEVENFYRAAKFILGWSDYQMRKLAAIENHVLLMMVTHAYLEIQRRDALDNATQSDAHFTLGDLQREHQRLAQRSTIALVFSLAQQGLGLDAIYERLAA